MVDQRQTLANLKYLLVVCGSGRGEVPGRKRGVVGALAGEEDGEGRRSQEVQEREMDEEGKRFRSFKAEGKGKGKGKAGNGGLIGGEFRIG